jgi:hypothetical protein
MFLHPNPSSPITNRQQRYQTIDDKNYEEHLLSSDSKSRRMKNLQRTQTHTNQVLGSNSYSQSMQSPRYHASHHDLSLRSRYTSSKKQNHFNAKDSSHEWTRDEFNMNTTQDESTHHQQQQTPRSYTQRLNIASFDATTRRKSISPSKATTLNTPMNNTTMNPLYSNSTYDLHRSETTLDRTNIARFVLGGTFLKEHSMITSKKQIPSIVSNEIMPASAVNRVQERSSSVQSCKSRDVNVSYAYTDVKKYIADNDLMSPEKERIIRNWIIDVEKHRDQSYLNEWNWLDIRFCPWCLSHDFLLYLLLISKWEEEEEEEEEEEGEEEGEKTKEN